MNFEGMDFVEIERRVIARMLTEQTMASDAELEGRMKRAELKNARRPARSMSRFDIRNRPSGDPVKAFEQYQRETAGLEYWRNVYVGAAFAVLIFSLLLVAAWIAIPDRPSHGFTARHEQAAPLDSAMQRDSGLILIFPR